MFGFAEWFLALPLEEPEAKDDGGPSAGRAVHEDKAVQPAETDRSPSPRPAVQESFYWGWEFHVR